MPINPAPPEASATTEAIQADAPQSALGRGIRVLQCFSTAEPDLSARDLLSDLGMRLESLVHHVETAMGTARA